MKKIELENNLVVLDLTGDFTRKLLRYDPTQHSIAIFGAARHLGEGHLAGQVRTDMTGVTWEHWAPFIKSKLARLANRENVAREIVITQRLEKGWEHKWSKAIQDETGKWYRIFDIWRRARDEEKAKLDETLKLMLAHQQGGIVIALNEGNRLWQEWMITHITETAARVRYEISKSTTTKPLKVRIIGTTQWKAGKRWEHLNTDIAHYAEAIPTLPGFNPRPKPGWLHTLINAPSVEEIRAGLETNLITAIQQTAKLGVHYITAEGQRQPVINLQDSLLTKLSWALVQQTTKARISNAIQKLTHAQVEGMDLINEASVTPGTPVNAALLRISAARPDTLLKLPIKKGTWHVGNVVKSEQILLPIESKILTEPIKWKWLEEIKKTDIN